MTENLAVDGCRIRLLEESVNSSNRRNLCSVIFFFAAAFSFGLEASSKADENCCEKHYRATIRHIESGGIGYTNGYTTLETFLASDPNQHQTIPFLDFRGHIFNNGKWAANAGIGLRSLWKNRAYGINAYYDWRNTRHLNSNQIGAGIETLGELFDFRINGYLPVGTKTSNPYSAVFEEFSENYMIVSQKIKSAMKGANMEFGFHFAKSESFAFYAAAGPYYFIADVSPPTWGGKARISGTFKDLLTLEISDSYDRTFHNKFQGQISLTLSFGPKSINKGQDCLCKSNKTLNKRMLQQVDRQEIIVIDNSKKNAVATNPATGLPYLFVFVDNTSSSNGTYESPYHTLDQAQINSAPTDIIYVFPGDGTTAGMNRGISLKANQKFWGSGVSHLLQTSQGNILIPAQSNSSPIITNTDIDTEGNAVTLATNNVVSGFTIRSALNDAIYGTDPQSLEVSLCTFENTTTYAIEATFPSNASISVTNNKFLNNVNGILLTLNETSFVNCSNNLFESQSSVSSFPLEIVSNNNTIATEIKSNIFNNNTTGSIRFNLANVQRANISLIGNTITNNGTGSQGTLGSSVVIIPNANTENCSITVANNMFSNNGSNSLYFHTSGSFTNLDLALSRNNMSANLGSGLAFGSNCNNFNLYVTNNTLVNLSDNGIATVGTTPFQSANITINNNTITDIGNGQSAVAISQASSDLNFTAKNNTIYRCSGSGIFCYSSEFTNFNATISGNEIRNCQNEQMNAGSALSLDSYLNLTSTIENNIFSDNVTPCFAIGSFTTGNPAVCLTLNANSSDTNPGYLMTNPGTGAFNLSPCNANSSNIGIVDRVGTITYVQSCPEASACP